MDTLVGTTILKCIQLGNGFNSQALKEEKILVQLLMSNGRKGIADEHPASALCSCTVAWVKNNPRTISPLTTDYFR